MTISSRFIKSFTIFFLFMSLFFNRDTNVFIFYISFVLTVFIGTVSLFKKEAIKFERNLIAFLLFIVWSALSLLWTRNLDLSVAMLQRLLILFLMMISLNTIINNNKSLLIYGFYGLVFGLVLNTPLLFVESFYVSGRLSGTTSNPNHLAVLSLFIFFSALFLQNVIKSKVSFYSILILSVLIVFATGSRKGFAFLVIVSLLYFLFGTIKRFNFSRVVVMLFASLSLFLVITFNLDVLVGLHPVFERMEGLINSNFSDLSREGFEGDASTRWRFIFIVEAFKLFVDNPLLGIGLDNFKTLYSEKLYSHNNYVELLATLGVVGFCLYYLFVYFTWKSILREQRIVGVSLFIVILMLDFGMVSYFERLYILPMLLLVFILRQRFNA